MSVSSETKLNHDPTVNYNSFGSLSHLADGSFQGDLKKKHGVKLIKNKNGKALTALTNKLNFVTADITVLELVNPASGSPELPNQTLQKADMDLPSEDSPVSLCVVPALFILAVTVALVLQISLAKMTSRVFAGGVSVSDHDQCTEVGQKILGDGGSSVDAAVAAALCLGVVHPHASGIGGGGVMMIHDVYKNETKVISFPGSAPRSFRGEMLQNVSELKTGLLVGVPGMLMGLHRAHRLYGRLSWEDVVRRASAVAREGFNVSHSLSEAILKVQGEQLSARFRDTFTPRGRPLTPGAFVRMPALAAALEAGLFNFYHGNLSREIEDEVQANGGTLTRQDLSNYSAEVEQPLEGQYNGFIVQLPPPPSAAATALISVMKLLEDFDLSENNVTENQTLQWLSEALRTAFHAAGALDDREFNSSAIAMLPRVLSNNLAEVLRQWSNESSSSLSNSSSRPPQTEQLGGQVAVMGPDNLVVAVSSSLGSTFGSRIVTPSGIILNSFLLHFKGSHVEGQRGTEQKQGKAEKMPQVFLTPTIIIPARHKCGIYVAVSCSGGPNPLRAVIQMLTSTLFSSKDKNDSLSIRGHQLQPNTRLIESEFPDEEVQFLDAKGQKVQRMKANSVTWIIKRKENIVSITKRPH